MALLYEDKKVSAALNAAWNGNGTAPAGSVSYLSAPTGSVIAFEISGTFVATVQFEGLIDETNGVWRPLSAYPQAGGAAVSSATAPGAWFAQLAGYRVVRVRCSGYTSGTINSFMNATAGVPTSAGAGSNAPVFPAAAASADATANPTLTQIESFPMIFNGTTWDRMETVGGANNGTGTGLLGAAQMIFDVTNVQYRRALSISSGSAGGLDGTRVPATGPMVYQGANVFQPIAQALTANAQAATGIQAMGLAGYNGTNFDPIRSTTTTPGRLLAGVCIGNALADGASSTLATLSDETGAGRLGAITAWLYNGSTMDRLRNNTDLTVLASGARTTTQTSNVTTYNARGIAVYIQTTAIGTGSITPSITYVDPVSSQAFTILTGVAMTTNTTQILRIYPGITATANVSASDHVSRVIQVVITANNANSATYSVGATLLY